MAKVHFIPYAKCEIRTELRKTQVLNRISSEISTQSQVGKLLMNDNKRNFRGSVGTNSFKLRKILDHRNSWNPILTGQLSEDTNGTIINLKITIHPGVLVFSFVWVILVLAFGLANINSLEQVLWPFGMLVLLYALTFIFFNLATEQAVDALHKAINKNPL